MEEEQKRQIDLCLCQIAVFYCSVGMDYESAFKTAYDLLRAYIDAMKDILQKENIPLGDEIRTTLHNSDTGVNIEMLYDQKSGKMWILNISAS